MENISLFNDTFREFLKETSKKRTDKFITRLSSLFDTPEFHLCRSTMEDYYFKYPKIRLDKETACKMLSHRFKEGLLSVVDYRTLLDDDLGDECDEDSFEIDDPSTWKQASLNWYAFEQELLNKYWASIEKPENFIFYKDRDPNGIREMVLSGQLVVSISGEPLATLYSFFDVSPTLKYYEKLFAQFLPEYPLQKEVSTKKIKRYAKDIGNGIKLGFYVNYAALEKELKYGYLEFPPFLIEAFSSQLAHPITESNYLKGQIDQPIIRIQPFHFMGTPSDSRLGDSSERVEELQKKLHFHFAVFAFYARIYLKEVAEILLACSTKQNDTSH
ncbi:hypothetical protein L3C95_21630 [Chitinophaga filiformis]|uniref:hypothetical protein n=1 Tax=Chitinophaga filiformis TaxID=104663 RepID=UPI001F311C87|nr:hypothetical protein [Chitinophaga filiformis]MCF6405520.1 hypothetical protein [Chitinophaga filiformis]